MVSHETMYCWIWEDKRKKGTLYKYLRRKGKKYNNRGSSLYLFNGSIEMRKGDYVISDVIRHEMKQNPSNPNNVCIFMPR